MTENLIILGAGFLLYLLHHLGWMQPIIDFFNRAQGKTGPAEPDAQPTSDTPLLDVIETLLTEYANIPEAKIVVAMLRQMIKNNPPAAAGYIAAHLPLLKAQLDAAKNQPQAGPVPNAPDPGKK